MTGEQAIVNEEKAASLQEERVQTYWSDLHLAVMAGNVEKVRELLDNGADINERERAIAEYTALALAVTHGHIEIVRLLLERGADPNEGNNYVTPLHLAELYQNNEIAELLRQHGGVSQIFNLDDE